MTLQQLKYAAEVAGKGSINEAAKSLFISQPSLSSAIRELESEIKLNIFIRTNRGIRPSVEGAEFLRYARQVLQQAELLEERYISSASFKQRFSVSAQHYTFTANAFVDLIKEFGADEYEFTFREEKTYDVIEDVKNLRSELGIIYLSNFNSQIINKLLKESGLVFKGLFRAKPHIFICRCHPLASMKLVRFADLENYPCLTFEQGEHNSFYYSEEILSTMSHRKSIRVTDRAAIINLLIGLDAYTISTGVFPDYLHGDDIISLPLDADEDITVGAITHKDVMLSRLGEIYISAIRKIVEKESSAVISENI